MGNKAEQLEMWKWKLSWDLLDAIYCRYIALITLELSICNVQNKPHRLIMGKVVTLTKMIMQEKIPTSSLNLGRLITKS